MVPHRDRRVDVLWMNGRQLHTNHIPLHPGATACNTQCGVFSYYIVFVLSSGFFFLLKLWGTLSYTS